MSLFGAPAASAAPTFSFGAPASTAAPAASTPAPSLFGGASTGGGGLFGAPKPKPATPSGGLLGQQPATSAPAPSGGLFGAAAPPAGGAPKPAFSFGAPASSTTPAAGTGGGLFGSAAPAPAAGGGLFGASTTAAPATGGGLFGQPQQQQQPAAGGLFGQPAGQGFGASTAQAPQQQQPQQPPSGINKNTKFNDLPDGARNVIEEMDKFIRSQTTLADELERKDFGEEIEQTGRMFSEYAAESAVLTSLLSTTHSTLLSLRHSLELSLLDLAKVTTLIDGYKGGPQGPKAAEAKAVANFPYEYFRRKTDEMMERVGRYAQTMEQISSLLQSPSHSLSPASIGPTLKAQHASLLSLASSVSSLDLELKGLKDEYRVIYREKTGRGVDPFPKPSATGGLERGVGGLAIR